MKRTILVVGVLLAVANVASAELVQGIYIDFVTIGNPGNPGDTRTDSPDDADPYGCGSVGYEYRIGKYEVTNAQWYDFVTAPGSPTVNPSNAYNGSASYIGDNQPTNQVSWYQAAQFCNYLTSGDKSQGAYKWSGNKSNPGSFKGIDRDSAVSAYGVIYVLPTENEWYKAAYYTGSGYSTYANGTDTAPIPGTDTNYGQPSPYTGPWEVGVGNGTEEQNGTFDMMGNVLEWNETLIYGPDRGFRGGSYSSYDYYLGSSTRQHLDPYLASVSIGFRVASVPEPCSMVLLGLGGLILRRKKR